MGWVPIFTRLRFPTTRHGPEVEVCQQVVYALHCQRSRSLERRMKLLPSGSCDNSSSNGRHSTHSGPSPPPHAHPMLPSTRRAIVRVARNEQSCTHLPAAHPCACV